MRGNVADRGLVPGSAGSIYLVPKSFDLLLGFPSRLLRVRRNYRVFIKRKHALTRWSGGRMRVYEKLS